LRYADRNSMAHSREVRLPFLYHELIEFLFTLPATMKINEGWTKWIMRETFDILPKEIGWRTDKIGYEPPQQSWMESEQMKNSINCANMYLKDKQILNNQYSGRAFTENNIYSEIKWRILMLKYSL